VEEVFRLIEHVDIFLLVFARILGIFLSVPIFSNTNIPSYIKIGFSLIVALILFPVIQIPSDIVVQSIYALIFSTIQEVLLGIAIGFVCYLFFSSLYLAGHLIDMEMGFSIVNVMNPQDDTEIPLIANLFYILASLIFLAINAHHVLIQALKYSFEKIPLGFFHIHSGMFEQMIQIMTFTFVIGFKMAAPVVIALFMADILLGILARTMPQMNVFIVGLPLKILLGLIVLLLIFSLYIPVFENLFDRMFEALHQFLNLILR